MLMNVDVLDLFELLEVSFEGSFLFGIVTIAIGL